MIAGLVTLIYGLVFTISEFRLKKIRQLTSLPYLWCMLACAFGILIGDNYYDFTYLSYGLLLIVVMSQIYSFILRSYLWHDNDNGYSRLLHYNAGYYVGEEYHVNNANIVDCAVFIVLLLYQYVLLRVFRGFWSKYNL